MAGTASLDDHVSSDKERTTEVPPSVTTVSLDSGMKSKIGEKKTGLAVSSYDIRPAIDMISKAEVDRLIEKEMGVLNKCGRVCIIQCDTRPSADFEKQSILYHTLSRQQYKKQVGELKDEAKKMKEQFPTCDITLLDEFSHGQRHSYMNDWKDTLHKGPYMCLTSWMLIGSGIDMPHVTLLVVRDPQLLSTDDMINLIGRFRRFRNSTAIVGVAT